MKRLLLASGVTSGAILAGSASAQTAMKASDPFVATAERDNLFVQFVQKLPTEGGKTKVWQWTMFSEDRNHGDDFYNSGARLLTIECNRRRVIYGDEERYRGDKFIGLSAYTPEPAIAPADEPLGLAVNAACDPAYNGKLSYQKHAEALAGAREYLGKQ